jgi:multiple antibiotic resistance protein
LSVTGGNNRLAREMVRRVVINGFFLLARRTIDRRLRARVLGLSIPNVRVAGRIVVSVTGWRLLNDAGEDDVQRSVAISAEKLSDAEIPRRSFMPMSFPLTVGPGSIAAAITLGAKRPEQIDESWPRQAPMPHSTGCACP